MKKHEKKKLDKKKNQKLVVQTGIFITLILSILALILIFIINGLTFFLKNQSIKDNMYVNLMDVEDSIEKYTPDYIRQYIFENPEALLKGKDYTIKTTDTYETDPETFDRMLGQHITSKYFNGLSEEKKEFVAFNLFSFLFHDLLFDYNKHNFKELIIVDVTKENHGNTLIRLDKSSTSDDPKEFYDYDDIIIDSHVGTKSDYVLNDHPAAEEYLNGSTNPYETEKLKINGEKITNIVAPIYENNELTYIISISFKTEELTNSDTVRILFRIVTRILIGIIITSILISIFLFSIIIKPLTKIKTSIMEYINEKDSSKVDKEMSSIKSRNEMGLIANNFRKLTAEIDHYNEENIDLVQEREKIAADLSIAAKIQDDMLIKEFPDDKAFKLFASMTPAREVGGDFYDFFMVDDDHLVLIIADVAGKGVPASLVMMSTITSIRSYASLIDTPSEILKNINEENCSRNNIDMFVTVWLGILDLNTGILTTSNAGHDYPAININGSFELFKDKHGFVIGGMPGMKYKDEKIQLKSGDSIFVYTDGVPEATNSEEKLFGINRMLEELNKSPDSQPEDLINNVKASVDKFVGEADQFDDLTMLAVKYYG